MEERLDATLGAAKTVQPALARFYNSLSDEQKARFNSLRSASRPVAYPARSNQAPSQLCGLLRERKVCTSDVWRWRRSSP
jgi:hypothetical protein